MAYLEPIQFNPEKFKDVVHYVCSKCSAANLGAVKLHKVLYFSDMIRYAWAGEPITGVTYRKRPFGPTADSLLPAIRELQATQRVSVEDQDYFGYRKRVFISHADPDTSRLNADEIVLLDEVIDFVCRGNTARSISDFSHNHVWERTDSGEPIPYYTAFDLYPAEISEEVMAWAAGEAEQVEAARSERSSVDYTLFAAMRGRLLQAGS